MSHDYSLQAHYPYAIVKTPGANYERSFYLRRNRWNAADYRFQIQQILVHADLEDAGNPVFRLPAAIAIHTTLTKLTDSHVSHRLRDDLKGRATAAIAINVLVLLVSWSGESTKHVTRPSTAAPGAFSSRWASVDG